MNGDPGDPGDQPAPGGRAGAAAASSPPPPAAEPLLPAEKVTRKNALRLSLVWLVPLVALVLGAGLVVQRLLAVGPTVDIVFRTAEGLEAGKTELRYKEVVVGRVQSVLLRPDRERVLVRVQLERSAANLAVADSNFWVVRPRIGVGGVSGLGTLLSGAYIACDAGTSKDERTDFVGLEAPPFVLRGEPGASFVLRADDLGSLDVGSPVFYRRTRVGRVVGYTLDPGTDALEVKIFIDSPYERLVTPQTRFWNASGVDLTLNAGGLKLNTQTLASVLAGGVAFERPPDAPPPDGAAPPGSRFFLFAEQRAALAPPDGAPLPVRMVFMQSIRGLAIGAPLDFLGVEVGTVRAIELRYDERRRRFPVQVLADVYPLRVGAVRQTLLAAMPAALRDTPGADARVLRTLVASGLHAQLRTGNLLTNQLYVALDFLPDAAATLAGPARPDGVQGAVARPSAAIASAALSARRAGGAASAGSPSAKGPAAAAAPPPATEAVAQFVNAANLVDVPTAPGTLSELQPQVADIVQKVSKIPFDAIGRDLASTLKQTERAIGQLTPEAQQALAEVRRTLASVQVSLNAVQGSVTDTLGAAQGSLQRLDRSLFDERAPVQRDLQQTMAELQRAAASLRALTDYLQQHPDSLLRGKPADPPVFGPGGPAPK